MMHCLTFLTPRSSGPPPRVLRHAVVLAMLLLLPAFGFTQAVNCFSSLNAGDNRTYCEGEVATLDGGYQTYTGEAGTATLTWSIVSGDGEFTFGNTTGSTVSNENFNNTEGDVFGFPEVTFAPADGITRAKLRLTATSTDADCLTETRDLELFFDRIQNTPIDAFVNTDDAAMIQVLDDALGENDDDDGDSNGEPDNVLNVQNGDVIDLVIDEDFTPDNGPQFGDIRKYTVSYSDVVGMVGMSGLPAAGNYTQADFEAAFNMLTVVNMGCEDIEATLEVFAFYERGTNDPQPSGECPGPVTEIDITIAPRDEPTATLGADQLLEVCEDNDDFTITITGTANTEVSYQINGDAQSPLILDANGITTISFDATQFQDEETVNIVLTGAEFTAGSPCPVIFSKPLTVTIIPTPSLTAELVDADDAVICNINNGGPSTLPFRLTTNGPAGSYDFTIQEFADGELVEETDLTRTFTDNGDGTASFVGTLDINGVGGSDVIQNSPLTGVEMSYVVEGASFAPSDDNNVTTAECPNDMPDASFSFEIQKESYLVVDIDDSADGTITLIDRDSDDGESGSVDNPSADVTFCDGENFTLTITDPAENNASPTIEGSEALVDVQITDADDVLSAASGIYNFTDNVFTIDQVLEIPDDQTENSSFTVVLTPFIDNDGDKVLNDDEDCQGNPLTVDVTVRPAPTVTVAALDHVCEGETVDVVITAREAGTANLIVGGGGAAEEVPITEVSTGVFQGTFTSAPLDAGMNAFTVTTFDGDVASCAATVNQMVMVDVEDNPSATISVDETSICDNEIFVVTFTGTEGTDQGYTFRYSVDGVVQDPVSTDDNGDATNNTSVEVTFANNTTSGTITVKLLEVTNNTTLACDTDINDQIVTVRVEELPVVTCATDAEGPICSGNDYKFTFTAGSDLESAIGSELYFAIVMTTDSFDAVQNQNVQIVEDTMFVAADANGNVISGTGENMSGFDKTITIEATPFYFDDTDGAPTSVGASCMGASRSCSIVVRTMPMVTLGGDSQLCEGEDGTLTFTGPPNGTFRAEAENEDGERIVLGPVYSLDGGGSAIVTLPGRFVSEDTDISILNVTSADGCSATVDFEFDINVTPTPEAEFAPQLARTVCEGESPVIELTGTPGATVTFTDGEIDPVVLDVNGEGSLTLEQVDQSVEVEIASISITVLDQNGESFTCTQEGDDVTGIPAFSLTVNNAPTGSLVSNRVLCADTESPEIQFNLTTENDDRTGTFTIVVRNDATDEETTFTGVENGDVLDFSGITLRENTIFQLLSIVEDDSTPNCEDITDGVIFEEVVIVNPVPVVAVDPIPTVICSGDEVEINTTFSPDASTPIEAGEEGNPLFFQVDFTDGFDDGNGNVVADDAQFRIPATEDLNAAIGLPTEFNNNAANGNDGSVAFTITPYFETEPDNPAGIEDCDADGFGVPVAGFRDELAEENWTTESSDGGRVRFRDTDSDAIDDNLRLRLPDSEANGNPNNNGQDDGFDFAQASYSFTEMVDVSFDAEYFLNDVRIFNFFFFQLEVASDVFIVNFEGQVTTRFGGQGTDSYSSVAMPGDELIFILADNPLVGTGQTENARIDIVNFEVAPVCQPCPGAPVAVEFEILPQLEADFDDTNPTRVCEGDQPTITFTGSPNTNVTVSIGGGFSLDVKLDDDGVGSFTPVAGLPAGRTTFKITGLTTLPPAQQCSRNLGGAGPMLMIDVTPTPEAAVSIDPDVVCAGSEELTANITSASEGDVIVNYSIEYDGATTTGSVNLVNGEGEVGLPTINTGTEDLAGTITLTGISATFDGVTCTNTLNGSDDFTVRPLPQGVLEADDVFVCNGETVDVTFTATTPVRDEYTLNVTGPNGFSGEFTAASGEVFFTAASTGTYTVTSISDDQDDDDTDVDDVCTNTAPGISIDVVIQDIPNIRADISGTVGTTCIDNDATNDASVDGCFSDIFSAVTCSGGTIASAFSSTTLTSTDADGNEDDLFVEIEIVSNDGLMGLPPTGTLNAPFGDLSFDGTLVNEGTEAAVINVILTPFFENDGTEGLSDEECAGEPIEFNITVLPAVQIDFDADSSSDVVCEGDDVTVIITGTAGGVVTFSTDNLIGATDSPVTLNEDGMATVTGTAGSAGITTVTIDMIQVTTNVGIISRVCMEMPDQDLNITVNEVPDATLSVEPNGPICNGETVDVVATLTGTDFEAGDEFTFTVDAVDYTATVDADGAATLFTSDALTVATTFELTRITNTATGCTTGDDFSTDANIQVEETPAVVLSVTGEFEADPLADGTTITLCANDALSFAADVSPDAPFNGTALLDVQVVDDLGFFAMGTGTYTEDSFADNFAATFALIQSTSETVTITVTPFIDQNDNTANDSDSDDDEDAGDDSVDGELDVDDCTGDAVTVTIVINPSPKTADVMTMVCSGEALDFDLDEGITNGLENVTYTYTVARGAEGDTTTLGENRTVGSSDNITDLYTNETDAPFVVDYTVTPTSAADCAGNNFTVAVMVKPEPVITADQVFDVCSGDDVNGSVALDNAGIDDNDGDENAETSFKIIAITPSIMTDELVADARNPVVGDEGGADLLGGFNFTNTSSDDQTVVVTLRPTSANGCEGADVDVTINVLPEAVVADVVFKVCSGNLFEVDIVEELTVNGVGDVVDFRRRSLDGRDGTLRAYIRPAGEDLGVNDGLIRFNANGIGHDENGTRRIQDGVIRDSLINFVANGPVRIFYDVNVANTEDCSANSFIIEVQVLAPRSATLDPADGKTAICAGELIHLVTTFDGTGTPSYEYSVISADDGVDITLTPSAAGGEVSVGGSGNGNATIQVMVTDDLGCVAMATRVVSVGNAPEELVISGPTEPCANGDAISFYQVVGNSTSTFAWAISNPAAGTFAVDNTTNEVDITFNTSAGFGPFILSVTETNATGCSTTSEIEITLTDETFADFSFEVDSDTREVEFMEEAGGSIQAYNWSYELDGNQVVFSNDANPTLTFPTDQDQYEVTLDVVGGCATTADGIVSVTKTVSLDPNIVTDEIELKRGTNFISFDVTMADNSVSTVFAGVEGLISVSTFENNDAKFYDPSRRPWANSLREIKDDYGYVVVVDRDQTMTVSGLPMSQTFRRGLTAGVNYVGHCAADPEASGDRLETIEDAGQLLVARTFGRNVTPNSQFYFPGRAAWAQSLKQFRNGVGYAIITNDNVDPRARVAAPTESYDFVFGTVTGGDFVPGDHIEVLNEEGDVVGTLITNADGTFAATPLYGKVDRPDGSIEGAFGIDDAVSFRFHGNVIENAVTFHGDYTGQRIDLDFGSSIADEVGFAASVYPNPAADQATVSLTTSKLMSNVDIVAVDATGRVVANVMTNRELSAGTTTVEFVGLDRLPAGMYHILIYSEGQMLPEATQRLVKR